MLLGDFNINWNGVSTQRRMLNDWSVDYDFEQMITSPTRTYRWKEETRNTLIDLCFNRGKGTCQSSVKDLLISDHLAIIIRLGRTKPIQCFKIIRKVKFSTEVIKSARESKLNIEEDCNLDIAVEKLTNWCQEMKDRATTEKRVRCDKPKLEMSEEIRNVRILICLRPRVSEDYEKMRSRLVDATSKANRLEII